MASFKPFPQATIIQAPSPLPPTSTTSKPVLFLSGSILPAPALSWQTTLSISLSHLPITILNPLRPDWDSSWVEEITFPPFREQVTWELNGLESADVIAVFFAKGTLAAITLMELGLIIQKVGKKVVVVCEEGYWKRGNVQVVCERFGVEVLGSMEELIRAVEEAFEAILRNDVEVEGAA